MTDRLKVLNIEDSEDDALLVMRELRRSGLSIIWERVETAEALFEALEKQTWDVIISDYHLPKFNAADALYIIKGRYPNLPFIVVSGKIGETAAVELMRAGAQDYLMKGSLARLSEAVRREVRDAENRLERQRSQHELDLVKERLQLAVEGSGIGLWDWAIQTDEVIINERLAEIFGYTLDELEQFGTQTWWQLNHPEDSQKAKLEMDSHFQYKTHFYECELRKRHKSGAWVWVLSRGKVVEWDMDGKPLRMTGTILDISDRKQTELRVEMQNSILERIAKGEPLTDILDALVRATEDRIEGAICSILLCDRQGKLRHGASSNLPTDYIKAIEGITIGEGVGSCGTAAFRKQPVIVSDIATDPLWQDYKDLALAYNLRSCWSFPAIASDGSVLATFAVYHHDVHSPQQPELDAIAIAADIVKIAIEREQATQALEQLNSKLEDRVERRTRALRQSEARLHEAQQIAHLGSWEIDLLSQKLNWSAEVFKIFGLDPNQPEPTYAEMLQYYPLDERKRVNDFVDKAMQGQPYETDFQIIRVDGSSAYTFAKTEPIWDAAGQVIGLFGIVMDISDRKLAEAQLQKINEKLLHATKLKDEFLANMSHELRTPLNSILGMTEGLQEGVFGSVNEQQIKALQTVERSGTHLLELINDILDVAKIESGQIEFDYTLVSVSYLCQSSLAFVKQQAMKKRIHLEIELPQNLPDILVDERRIRQVLINLLNNAVKFTLEGGHIILEVTQLPPSPDFSLERFLRIAVIDTGIGIAPENIKKLFQPFIQIDSALNRQYAGTGLGLTLVKQITELHGGRVGLTSELGVGSCFMIDLPYKSDSLEIAIDKQTSTTPTLISPLTNQAIPNPLILIADDNEANISTVSNYLEAKGYRLLVARNGKEAVDLATAQYPDLILMDIQMPVMDGLEATKQIRLDPKLINIPIIALTALAMTGDREKCLEVGVNEYLTKPFKLKVLAITIQQLLG
jgi:PAS domain S-box-containing protein